ncbi:MAG: hypothetical protein LBD86_05290 [Spirochaetaceae bacterium]|nr:hypothetical protein [Spirochaetaceae bacterium]
MREPVMGLTFEKVWAMFQETDRQSKETDRKINKLGNRLGDSIEDIVRSNLSERFKELHFNFGQIGTDIRFEDSEGKSIAEVDIMPGNGDDVVAMDVKTKLTTQDAREHAKRMEKLRKYADNRNYKRDPMGAVAGAIVPENVKQFALNSGFFVIEQSGYTVKIDVPPGFVPKKW